MVHQNPFYFNLKYYTNIFTKLPQIYFYKTKRKNKLLNRTTFFISRLSIMIRLKQNKKRFNIKSFLFNYIHFLDFFFSLLLLFHFLVKLLLKENHFVLEFDFSLSLILDIDDHQEIYVLNKMFLNIFHN